MRKATSKLGLLIGVGLMVVLSACSYANTSPAQNALVYAGGWNDQKFKKCTDSSKREGIGETDKVYYYPSNQRDFQFAPESEPNREREPISTVSKDSATLYVSGIANFSLNTNCDILRSFHEKIGTNYGPQDGGELSKWNDMLRKYVGVPLENAIDNASKDYDWKKLAYDPTTRAEWQKKVATQFTASVNQLTGNKEYFCNPGFSGDGDCGDITVTLNQPTPDQKVLDATNDAIAQKERTQAQNDRINSEMAAQKNLIALLGVQGYLEYQNQQMLRDALAKGNVPFVPVPQGGTINYTPVK